jgi:hypothetical protein
LGFQVNLSRALIAKGIEVVQEARENVGAIEANVS